MNDYAPEPLKVTVVKEFKFDAAHYLPDHPGKCRNLHGHTYMLRIGVTGTVDEKTGMVTDFSDLKRVVESQIIDLLDHSYLNEVIVNGFPFTQPTAERMVLWIHDILLAAQLWSPTHIAVGLTANVGTGKGDLSFIQLYETPTSYAEWRGK